MPRLMQLILEIYGRCSVGLSEGLRINSGINEVQSRRSTSLLQIPAGGFHLSGDLTEGAGPAERRHAAVVAD
jgi:hypothetical protein